MQATYTTGQQVLLPHGGHWHAALVLQQVGGMLYVLPLARNGQPNGQPLRLVPMGQAR